MIWEEAIANGAVNPQINGLDDWGSISLVADQNMSDDPDQLKARVYNYLNRIKLGVGTGLEITYTSSFYITRDGELLFIPAGSLVLNPNVTGFVYINAFGVVQFSLAFPLEGDPLGLVATSLDSVVALSDLREQAIARSHVLRVPEARSAFSAGDIKLTFSRRAEAGWLLCDGSLVDPTNQPDLFDAVGYDYGREGDLFRLPDPDNRMLLAVADRDAIGILSGSNTVRLSTQELPRHIHPLFQNPHLHRFRDFGHEHGIIDTGHSHTVEDPGHSHKATEHRYVNIISNYEFQIAGSELSKKGTGQFMPVTNDRTGINIASARTGIVSRSAQAAGDIDARTIQIRAEPTGESQPFSVQNSNIGVGILIKT